MNYFKLILVPLLLLVGCTADSITDVADEETLTRVEEEALETTPEEMAHWKTPVGTVTPVFALPDGESPEGIAMDRRGNMYVGVRTWLPDRVESKILRVSKHGKRTVLATLPASAAGTWGILGLTTDRRGNVYAAFVSGDPETQGVYKVSRNGSRVERLAGSEQIETPNALTRDARGNLYVTDSYAGKIWRYGRDRVFREWLDHPVLDPVPVPGALFQPPGANGIVFYPGKLYVANSSQFIISRVRINRDGSAGEVEVVAGGLIFVDGIVVDVKENIYGVLATANQEEIGAPSVPPVVKANPHTGEVVPVLEDESAFDAPTSLVFGRTWGHRRSVYVVNSALLGVFPTNPGPGVVEVFVGVPGFPGM